MRRCGPLPRLFRYRSEGGTGLTKPLNLAAAKVLAGKIVSGLGRVTAGDQQLPAGIKIKPGHVATLLLVDGRFLAGGIREYQYRQKQVCILLVSPCLGQQHAHGNCSLSPSFTLSSRERATPRRPSRGSRSPIASISP